MLLQQRWGPETVHPLSNAISQEDDQGLQLSL